MPTLKQLLDVSAAPLIYALTTEERRVVNTIRAIAAEKNLPVHTWSCVTGLDADGTTTRPVDAVKKILTENLPGYFIFNDIAPFLDDPITIRALREAYNAGLGRNDRAVYLVCADNVLPNALKKEVHWVDVAPPVEQEIADILDTFIAAHPSLVLTEDARGQITMALKGLTEDEILFALAQVIDKNQCDDTNAILETIFEEKQAVVKKTGFLEFAPPKYKIDGLGGLDNLKQWLLKRQHTFSQEAVDAGVPIPKGLLIMGISGCGKSLAIKTISSLWNIPLFRLDMNLVFSGMYGSPEAAFHKAMKTIEAVAPAVLWIDEIENALGLDDSGHRIASHIFSTFLTWMQEKPPLVFIAATANKIEALPAEILRKGRFDEVFFCDLPSKEERSDIFKIHLKRNNADLDKFDFKMLEIMTDGWNGAEIEQAVIGARTDAFFEQREFDQHDLENVIGRIVPLSETMEQQIKTIRSWAFSRATPASKYSRTSKH